MKKLIQLFYMAWGYVWFRYYLVQGKTQFAVRLVFNMAYERAAKSAPREKTLYMLVGFSGSGKTTLVKNHQVLKSLFQIDTAYIHDGLNGHLLYLQGPDIVSNPCYWVRQFLTRKIKFMLFEEALRDGYALVDDSCNLSAVDRDQKMAILRKHGYKVVLVHVVCAERVLLERLRERNEELQQKGENPNALELYYNVQKPRYNSPMLDPVDYFVTYYSDNQEPADLKL